MSIDIYGCSKEELQKNSKIPFRVMPTESDIYREIADIMLQTIKANNEKGKRTVIICPVGPIGQYKPFAKSVNEERVSLKNCFFINMDEYVTETGESIDKNSALSFYGVMKRELYDLIDEELNVPESQRIFPDPINPKNTDKLLDDLKEIDLCLTGVGINGHIAFNEPPSPEEEITDQQYKMLKTRVLKLNGETLAINGSGKYAGALDIFPKRCVTLGVEQLLRAKVIKVYFYVPWQWGIIRKIALGEVTRFAPASYLQEHPNAEMVCTKALFDFELKK